MTRTCEECGRVFDMLDPTDAEEYTYGHDCEARNDTADTRVSTPDPRRVEGFLKEQAALIHKHGWTAIGVFAAADDPGAEDYVPFLYSIGMAKHGGREFLVAGLPHKTAHMALWAIWQRLQDGWRPTEWALTDEILNVPVRLVTMTDEHEANSARSWNRAMDVDRFTVMQVFWPDADGHYPDEEPYDCPSQHVNGTPDGWR